MIHLQSVLAQQSEEQCNANKSVLSLVPPNTMLPASAAKCRRLLQLSINICCPLLHSAANQPHATAAVNQQDTQTDI